MARTVDLDPAVPIDLLAFAGDDGVVWWQGTGGLAGRGEAARVELPNGLRDNAAATAIVRDALAAIDVRDDVRRPATGPVAIGALPFDPGAAGSFVVPEVLVGRSRDGRQWLTTVGVDSAPELPDLDLSRSEAWLRDPDGFQLTSPISHDGFKALVARAVDAIHAGRFEKVVVAREVIVDTNRPISVPSVLERLHSLYPSCTIFSIDGFVGASPELLVERRGDRVRCHPLAGTFPRSGDPEADELLAARLRQSAKDQSEHRFVIDELQKVLGEVCDEVTVEGPDIFPLRNVLHLGTEMKGSLADPPRDAIELVALLHPTPAVGGAPTAPALEWLRDNEGLKRGRYGGPVGWVDRHGDGSFVVGIRSADISGTRARLFSGVGIVAGSEPESELVETQLKLQALLAALVRP